MRLDVCGGCPIYNDGLYQLGIRHNICTAPRFVNNEGRAKVLLVAEAFGENEDVVNQPLVGRSGKLLNQLMAESGLDQFDLKIDNTVKCRPMKLENGKYKNRTPTDTEIEHCRPYMVDTLAFDPDLIILLGRIPFKHFFPDKDASQYRGKGLLYKYNDKEVMAMLVYHPAACLYQASNKPTLLKHLSNATKFLQELEDGIK